MEWFEWMQEPQAWVALATLTLLEIVLGIDNIIFISILTGRLPEAERGRARRTGLVLAMLMRVGLLFALKALMELHRPLFAVFGHQISGRSLILIAGGLFLIAKATLEIHDKLEGQKQDKGARATAAFAAVLVQIAVLDMVFSLDSVITAIGMAEHLPVMIIAVVVSIVVMMIFVGPVCDFVERHPTFKILALSFLLLIGVALVGEGLEFEIPKAYIYFAMGFSLFVELLNMRIRRVTTGA